MAGEHGEYIPNPVAHVSKLESIERQIAESLNQTIDEIAHMECFDTEQRAELYTILQTLLVDTDAHRQIAGRLVQGEATANA